MSSILGIDAAKDSLVVASWGAPSIVTIDNTMEAIAAWLDTLPAGSRLGIEASGRYHLNLADGASARGHVVFVLNGRDVRHYARSLGHRGKTDRLDAQVIARYVAREGDSLRPYVTPPATLSLIESLLRQRAGVVSARVDLRQSLRHAPALAAALDQTLAQLDRLIAEIDALLHKAIGENTQRRVRWQRLRTLPGIGPLTAALLTSLFERIAFQNGDALVAFSGLDPRPCDSGAKRGRRVITKRGPAELRRLLFNAAMAFSRHSLGRALFERYRARQLSTTATYVILARKLLRIAWAVDHTGVAFDARRMTTP